MDDLLEEFVSETLETLEVLSGQLVQWERNPSDHELIDNAFRFVHTVKGSCGFLDLPRLMRLSHAAEDVLSAARDREIIASAGLVSATLEVIDQIGVLTNALASGEAVFDNDQRLIDRMLGFLNQNTNSETQLSKEEKNEVEEVGEIGFSVAANSRNVRVNLATLDNLMNAVSDLVLARNEMSRQLRKSDTDAGLGLTFTRLSTSVAEIRDAIGLLRMQNIDRLFAGLPRLLRDTCQELGKRVELQIEGGEVEVDREMVEALRDPLIHIIRNGVDHGIEMPDERLASGKDPVGTIAIRARQSGNQILLEISDDGRGINLAKLEERAIRAKLITAAEWQRLPEKDKLAMICAPGLSTAESITAISGRGVGMDVVNTNIRRIGGSIDFENNAASGLKITLRIPLTLSIISGLFVAAGDGVYGISRNSVIELLAANNSNVKIEKIGETEIASVRDVRMPYARLETILDLETDAGTDIVGRTLVVMRPAVGPDFVLDVAKVMDTEELVVKPGAPIIMASGLFSGISLPDMGKPMLLLDASGIAEKIDKRFALYGSQKDNISNPMVQEGPEPGASALVFTTQNGKKQAIRLSAIERMEDISKNQIHNSSGKYFVSNGDVLTDIVGMDDLPIGDNISFLKLSDGTQSRYLPVGEVLDMFSLTKGIKPSPRPDIYEGIVMLDGEPIELLNCFQFFESTKDSVEQSKGQPKLLVKCGEDDHWERQFLAPMLTASGYDVCFDDPDDDIADIILVSAATQQNYTESDDRIVLLRDQGAGTTKGMSSVYRYDRIGLLSAMAAKLSAGN
jgi:two-component system, chemotaxis family, sensor kinase CheA